MPAAISVGTNPQFDGTERTVEAYAIDRVGLDLYGLHVAVDFLAYVRGQAKFDSIDALLVAMADDVKRSSELIAAVRSGLTASLGAGAGTGAWSAAGPVERRQDVRACVNAVGPARLALRPVTPFALATRLAGGQRAAGSPAPCLAVAASGDRGGGQRLRRVRSRATVYEVAADDAHALCFFRIAADLPASASDEAFGVGLTCRRHYRGPVQPRFVTASGPRSDCPHSSTPSPGESVSARHRWCPERRPPGARRGGPGRPCQSARSCSEGATHAVRRRARTLAQRATGQRPIRRARRAPDQDDTVCVQDVRPRAPSSSASEPWD